MPMPMPPDGGKPCSMATRKSSSRTMASGSPLAAARAWASKRSRWTTGSASSE